MTRRPIVQICLMVITAAFAMFAQSRSNSVPLAFEVVSIKPAADRGNISGCRGIDSRLKPNDTRANVPLGRCIYSQTALRLLINQAYDLQAVGAIRNIPEWDRTAIYKIDAKAENPSTATEKQLFEMVQTMLADRFKLKYHRETEQVQGFALVVDKSGHKLQPSTADGDEDFLLTANNPPGTAALTAQKISMATVAMNLSTVNLCIGVRGPIAPVVDRTNLSGFFVFKLTWDMCRGDATENLDKAIRFTIKDQLGLNLESAKVPYSFFVIDSAEKPVTD